MHEDAIRITFVRHGQSVSNLAQRWQGQGDSPLSELGRAQAERVGRRLSQRTFTRVLSSDLSRAVDTARATGFRFEQDVQFREFDVGRWEGLTREEVEERYPEEMAQLKRGEDIPLGGGESYAAFSARIDAAVSKLQSQLSAGDHALVVCHGGVIATVLAGALGLRRAGQWALARLANTSITELSYSPSGAQLHVFNDTMHLSQLGSWPPHVDVQGVVGLVCDGLSDSADQGFAAHYDALERLAALGVDAAREAWVELLSSTLAEIHGRHPEHRIALSAHAGSIRAWAEQTLLKGMSSSAGLAPPRAGTVSHVGKVGERFVLLDYAMGEL